MEQLHTGLLVSLEGIDGSGKSTLAAALYKQLNTRKISTLLTKEPGGTCLGDMIRPLILQRTCRIDTKAEYLLFAAGRAQHFDEVVLPALDKGMVVISDRMADSSLVYQGYAKGLEIPMLETINSWSMNARHPDLTFYLKLSVDKALERIHLRGDATTDFEKRDLLQKSIEGFEKIFNNKPHVIILDALETQQTLAEQALVAVLSYMRQ